MKSHTIEHKTTQKPHERSNLTRPAPIQVPHLQSHLQSTMLTEILTHQPVSQQPEPQSGYQKPTSQKVQQLISLFKITDIPTKSYRLVIEQIAQSFTSIDSLTNHLQQKVDNMLKQQQVEFVESYKSHMKKIQEEFASVDKKIEEFQKKIAYYENEGEMSQLFIKVNQLQHECKKLYKDLQLKEKANKDHLLTIKVQKSQLKRYQKQLKALLREKNDLNYQLNQLKAENKKDQSPSVNEFDPKIASQTNQQQSERQDIQHSLHQLNSINSTKCIMFPTELQMRPRNDKSPNDLSTEYHFGSNQSRSRQHIPVKNSLKSLTLDLSMEKHSPMSNLGTPLLNKVREMQLKKQLNSLKKRNQMLNSFQSYVLQAKTDMQSFFIDCVNQIKQQIKIRKKISFCTFDEWKKQDKIELLIKIISNDDILAYLYQRVFKKKRLFEGPADNKKDVQSQENICVGQKDVETIYQRRFEGETIDKTRTVNKEESIEQVKEEKHKKVLSMAKRRFSKHISENSLLPKIHFHLEY